MVLVFSFYIEGVAFQFFYNRNDHVLLDHKEGSSYQYKKEVSLPFCFYFVVLVCFLCLKGAVLGVFLGAVGGPFRLGVLVELVRKVRTLLEFHVEVERRVGELFRRDGHGLEGSKEFLPFGLCLRVAEFGPRTALLERKPAGLDADRVHLIVPRTVVLHRNRELHGVLLVLFRGSARERHDGVDGNVSERLKECEAAKRVEEVRETVLARAVDATLDLIGPPVAVAVGALENERADVEDGLHGMLAGGLGWLVFGFSLRRQVFQFFWI
jgi:hypothetical protein